MGKRERERKRKRERGGGERELADLIQLSDRDTGKIEN